jgi:hypothetical protein
MLLKKTVAGILGGIDLQSLICGYNSLVHAGGLLKNWVPSKCRFLRGLYFKTECGWLIIYKEKEDGQIVGFANFVRAKMKWPHTSFLNVATLFEFGS